MNKKHGIIEVFLILLLLAGAFVSDYRIPNGDTLVYAVFDGSPMAWNRMYYYTGVLLFSIAFAGLTLLYSKGKIGYKIILWLLVGKLADLFCHPWGWSFPEIVVKILCGIELLSYLRKKFLKKGIVTSVALLFLCASSNAQFRPVLPPYASVVVNPYTHSYSITTDHTQCGSSSSSNFTVTVIYTATALKTVANGGSVQHTTTFNGQTVPADVVFSTSSSYGTLMNWGVQSYDGTAGTIVVHARLSSLSNTTNITFYMGVGNSSITTYQGGSVGSDLDANHQLVVRMPNASTLSGVDYSTNGYNGTITGATATTGEVDGCGSFPGGGTYITMAGGANLKPTNNITISAWLYATSTAGSYNKAFIFPYGSSSWTSPYFSWQIYCASSGLIGIGYNVDGNFSDGSATSSTHIVNNTWTHVVGTFATGVIKVYVNGSLVYTDNISSFGTAVIYGSGTSNAFVGTDANYFDSEYWTGRIDECKMSNTVRSADWILQEYNNEKPSSTFLTFTSIY